MNRAHPSQIPPSAKDIDMDSVEYNGDASASAIPNLSSVITNGAVSGVLPETEAFAVNYPGYPSSTSRAIDTLGGLDEISKARSSGSSQVELRFRPEDPYCHPTSGECRAFAGLLLKLTKTRPESDNEGTGRLSADVVARVNQAYHFEGMVDYQHVLPVHAAETRRKKHRRVFDEETDLGKEADVMMLVPPLFSLKDKPEEIVLIPPANLFSKNMQRSVVEHRWEMDIDQCLAISFNIEIPEKVNWEDNIPRNSEEWEIQFHVSKLFEERPIWPRWSIHDHLLDNGLQVTDHLLRRLLFRAGYYFSNGPFGRFWIRKGYDPRKDPESRIYQRVEYRVPSLLKKVIDANLDTESKQKWKDVCQFQVFPWKNACLQFFELADDYIQDEIRKPTDQTTCMKSRGWFSDTLLKTLRLRVSIRFLSICPIEGATVLLHSTCEEFERFKKLEAHNRFMKPLTKQLHRDPEVSSENVCADSDNEHQFSSQNNPNNYEIENEEDEDEKEVEEEEEEEEMDAYNSPAGAIEDGYFSPEPSSLKDSIANDYLQNLLDGFPLSIDGEDLRSNKVNQNTDLSDGEYQIYEQDSDDSYDDGDFS